MNLKFSGHFSMQKLLFVSLIHAQSESLTKTQYYTCQKDKLMRYCMMQKAIW